MFTLLLVFFSFSVFSQTTIQFGSRDRPQPFFADEFSSSAVTYEKIDWRNHQGANWLGPIRNQANCGSCVAFSTIATLEDQLTISSQLLWKKEAFSQEALFSCGRAKCSSGWFVWDAVRTVEKMGVVDVACAPYTAGSLGKVPVCGTFCENQSERTYRIKSVIHPKGAAEVKEALKRGPLITSMSVRVGFDSYQGGIFKSSMYDDILGGHAVELVGFNDLERYWIIKNSWGELWGENGYARISYDDAQGVGSDTYGFVVEDEKEGFQSPVEDQYLKGKFKIAGTLSEVKLVKEGRILSAFHCQQGCEIDSTVWEDGEYQLQTTAKSGRMLARRITVLNRPFSPVMKLSHPPSWNYDYPQADRVYFDVSFSGEIFPEVILMQIHQGKKLVFERKFYDVLATNRIGFNTTVLPNGTYAVSFKHRTWQQESAAQMMKLIIKN